MFQRLVPRFPAHPAYDVLLAGAVGEPVTRENNASVAHAVGHRTMGGPMSSPAATDEPSMVPACFAPLGGHVRKMA